jgi:hypothetical protein
MIDIDDVVLNTIGIWSAGSSAGQSSRLARGERS